MKNKHKLQAKELFGRDRLAYVFLTLLFFVIMSLLSALPPLVFPPFILVWSFAITVLIVGFSGAYKRVLMVIKNGRTVRFTRDVGQFILKQALPLTVTHLIKYFYLFCWYCLFIVPGLYKSLSYALVDYVIIDFPKLKYSGAITVSRQLMKGQKLRLIQLYLHFILWGIVIVLTFGLAYFYVKPYFTLALIDFYENCLQLNGYPGDELRNNSVENSTKVEKQLLWDDF